jgi:nucleoside-diphosphate-sugar epimerase
MRIVVIGGTGHVGTYLIPRLVNAGHEVVSVSRQQREPYQPHAAWQSVTQVEIDRARAEENGTFGEQIRALFPDAVIDMICFKPESAKMLVAALRGNVQHFLHCGTIWVHGPSEQVPTDESHPRKPFGEYGIDKAAIETYLLADARQNGFPATALHPGHIVGPGWSPLNPAGHFNPEVFRVLAKGEPLTLPNLGLETVHHVHADDVAQGFVQALHSWNQAVGESFHLVSSKALTLRGYAEAMFKWFGQEPNLAFLPWEAWREQVHAAEAAATWDHIAHSPNCSIAKAQRFLGYQPRYTSLEAVQEAVTWLMEEDNLLGKN